MKPNDIESLSFKIINSEAGDHGFEPDKWRVVQRMIHTTADFDYMRTVRFHPEAVSSGINAMKHGCRIITDTNMAKSGIRKGELSLLKGKVHCFIADDDVAERAAEEGITRAEASVDKAFDSDDSESSDDSEHNGIIYVIGNAPTALFRLIRLVKEKKAAPDLIIGVPVGFVNAKESKEALMELDIPFISNAGRKGGSNLAAAIVNALLIMAVEQAFI